MTNAKLFCPRPDIPREKSLVRAPVVTVGPKHSVFETIFPCGYPMQSHKICHFATPSATKYWGS